MFRYKLRTLLVLLAAMPPVLAGMWFLGKGVLSSGHSAAIGDGPLLAAAIVLVVLTLAIERG
jgi:hypothetical protein